ncbi:DUF1761 domain-containing protein [Cognatiluteimonas telluris]|uniref:DUF1761 domain-containing protein n=1 Tax=Cognatiluteimonas telluris TaxID=1104775 RepID=UPI00140DE392|nr:DUF1761 domain-containing protein [Lysobacter telluris]
MTIQWLAIVVAALSAFVLGGIWYGPLFRHAWCREAGVDAGSKPRHPSHVFARAFVASFIAATAFAWLIGPAPGLRMAVIDGVVVGLGVVATSFALNYGFAGRSPKLWLIDGGYHTLQFTLYGLILGLWQ